MKNLKLFVFSLCLMLVAVLSVNAARPSDGCVLNLEDLTKNTCQAQVTKGKEEDIGLYANAQTAMDNVLKNGGEVTFYVAFGLGTNANNPRTIDKNVTITIYGDNMFTLGVASSNTVTVADGGSLTVNGKNVTMAYYATVNKGGKLVLNATNVTANNALASVAGTFEVSANTKVEAGGSSAITVWPNAVVTLNGKINAGKVVQAAGTYSKQDEDKDAVVTINGGTYKASNDAFVVKNGYVLNISNATVTAEGRVVDLENGKVTISSGEFTSTKGTGILVTGADEDTSLTISNGTVVTKAANKYALFLSNPNATYAISGGTFESRGAKGLEAIMLDGPMFDNETGKLAVKGILTGGKYLNIITKVITNKVTSVNYDPNGDLVAEGYEIKEEVVGKDTYKVIVKTGTTDVEPEKQPEATKPGSTGSEELPPDTYDAGLAYMGLALAAVGASVVSIKKLRNN